MAKTPTRYKIILAIALVHLALVVAGTIYVDFGALPLMGRFLEKYNEATGSGDNYGFFSPGVFGQLSVWFDLEDAEGHHQRVHLNRGSFHESEIRVGDIIDQFGNDHDDVVGFQRAMTASFAATIAARYPEARKISVHIEKLVSISMEDFRGGSRLEWKPLYQADFVPPQRRNP